MFRNKRRGQRARPMSRKIKKRELLAAPGKRLNKIAKRALREAAARRRKFDAADIQSEDCCDARLEPTRYGDWESDGKCSDF